MQGCSGDDPELTPPSTPTPVMDENRRTIDLACPGGPGCEAAQGALRVGVAAVTITPELETWTDTDSNGKWDEGESFEDVDGNGKWDGIWLAGFGNGRAATSIHDDSWARVITLEQGDVSMALVSLDLVGLFQSDVLSMRQAAQAAGLDFDHVAIASTHTHEAVDTMGMWGPTVTKTAYDPEMVARMTERVVEALRTAKQGQREASMRIARTEAPELLNDTREPNVYDQDLHAIQFLDVEAKPFVTAVIWGNHPEALGSGNTAYSSDYVHFLRERIESEVPGTTAVFFSGSLGGLSTTIGVLGCPDADGLETCPQGTFERAAYVGEGAADAALAALAGADAVSTPMPSLAFKRKGFLLPITNSMFALAFSIGLFERSIYHADGTLLTPEEVDEVTPNAILAGDLQLATEVNALTVGELTIASVPGELYPELWMVKADGSSYIEQPEGRDFPDATPETPIQSMLPAGGFKAIFNNGNDAIGYVIPKTQFDAKAPHAYEEDGQYGEENSTGYDTAPLITSEFAEMMSL